MEPIRLHVDADPDCRERMPVLVLLHGINLDGGIWNGARDALRRIGPTASVDLLGHGASPAPADPAAYTPDAYVAHFEDVLARLGVPTAWWLGYSMGGFIVQRVALQRPDLVQGLVLIATDAGIEDADERAAKRATDLELAKGTARHGMDWFFDRYYGRYPAIANLPPKQLAKLRALRTRNPAVGIANAMRGAGSGGLEPVWHRLGEIDVPALVLCGTEDARFVKQAPRMAAALPRSRLELIEGAGHPVVRQKPAELAAAVERFFADLP